MNAAAELRRPVSQTTMYCVFVSSWLILGRRKQSGRLIASGRCEDANSDGSLTSSHFAPPFATRSVASA